jgi:glutamate-1-semialdehyde 2,1-aminomutase
LIFDEVMTGFRLAIGGAQQKYGVKPDMTTLGKIIGGGLPVGAYGGKKEIMDCVSPAGPVYQAGTLSGNPLAMAAGMAMLNYLKVHPEVYDHIDAIGDKICHGLKQHWKDAGMDYTVNQAGSMFTLFFTGEKVTDYNSAKNSDTKRFSAYFQSMLRKGVYLAPSQFEAMFISYAITEEIAEYILDANRKTIIEIS